MELMKQFFSATLAVFQVPLTLFGFTFSFWDIFIWTAVADLLLVFIGGLFHD